MCFSLFSILQLKKMSNETKASEGDEPVETKEQAQLSSDDDDEAIEELEKPSGASGKPKQDTKVDKNKRKIPISKPNNKGNKNKMLMWKDQGSKRRRDHNGRLKLHKLGKRLLVFYLHIQKKEKEQTSSIYCESYVHLFIIS